MCMTHAEKQCRKLYRDAVKLRDVYCQFCGQPATHCHHIVLVSHGNWHVQYDLDYAAAMCAEHHEGFAQSPHVSPKLFAAEMLPVIMQRMDPARAAKIQAYLDRPKIAHDRPNWPKIKKRLKKAVETFDRENYMDADCLSA